MDTTTTTRELEFVGGSDRGPCCYRCQMSIWSYWTGRHVVARCVSCGYVEGPIDYLGAGVWARDLPKTATEARVMHEAFSAAA